VAGSQTKWPSWVHHCFHPPDTNSVPFTFGPKIQTQTLCSSLSCLMATYTSMIRYPCWHCTTTLFRVAAHVHILSRTSVRARVRERERSRQRKHSTVLCQSVNSSNYHGGPIVPKTI